jgi:hypothetical protein
LYVRQLADRLKREQKTNLGLRNEQKDGGVFIGLVEENCIYQFLIETMLVKV